MPATLDAREICLRAMTRLADAGVVAVVMLDENLRVLARHGRLADQVPLGVPIDEGLPHLTGLAPDLLNLQDEPDAIFALDNVGIAGADGTVKLNIEAFWIAEERHYDLLLHRLGLRSEPEAEIVKQIRARRIAEAHLHRTRLDLASQTSLLDALADRCPIALAVVGRDLDYRLATEAWRRLLGLSGDPLPGSRLADTPVTRALADLCGLERVLAGQALPEREIALAIGGQTKCLIVRASPLCADGKGGGAVIAVDEITGQAAETARLRAKIAALEASNRALEEFVATAAHDLNAPRRAIDAALATGGPVDRATIARHAARLKHMLADLIEHARTATGEAMIEPVDIASLARDILDATAGGERFSLVYDLAYEQISVERIPLEVALRNLIGNTVRHHDRATGTIEVGLQSDDSLWRLTVRDDGPGIPEAERERVLEPFRRPSHSGEGTGLGLSLVATAVRRLGGTIRIAGRAAERGVEITIAWPKHIRDAPDGLDTTRIEVLP